MKEHLKNYEKQEVEFKSYWKNATVVRNQKLNSDP